MRRLLPCLCLLLLGCGSAAEAPGRAAGAVSHAHADSTAGESAQPAVPDPSAPWPATLPPHAGAPGATPLAGAIQVWRLGSRWFDVPAAPAPPSSHVAGEIVEEGELEDEEIEEGEEVLVAPTHTVFRGLDRHSASFLRPPVYAQGAVQFSCAVTAWPDEAHHVNALSDEDPLVRLQALVVLMKVRAPRSIEAQWQTLQGLDALPDEPGAARLLGELFAAFAYPALRPHLARTPPESDYDDDHAQQWAARAAGLLQQWDALPRLRVLSGSMNLGTSLAAERALVMFPGPEADQALRHCVVVGRYNAWIHAASALFRRDPRLLEETLLHDDPQGARYQVAIFLGRLGNPLCVPMLCEEVARVNRIDEEMFALIEALAEDTHRALVRALPARVRPDQRDRAEAVRAAVLRRLGPAPGR